jgi:altronate dehydratase large subunit
MNDEFFGYQRDDGTVGIRNHVLILPSVICSSTVARRIAEQVPGTAGLSHACGCGQFGEDLEQTTRTLVGLALNPNVHSVLVIGLGCEGLPSELLYSKIRPHKPVEYFDLQEIQGGSDAAVRRGKKWATKMVQEARDVRREPFDFSHLILGTQCGGSDALSGSTANPVVGLVADKVIEQGGTVILPEPVEWIGTEPLLAARMSDETLRRRFLQFMNEFIMILVGGGRELITSRLMAPGNIEGGLTTIEEKSLGNIAKGGSAAIQGILRYATKPSTAGLWLMLGPAVDVSSMVGLAAAGAQAIIMTTGRGSPTGIPLCPVLKICGNPQTCDWMRSNIDVDASQIIHRKIALHALGDILWHKLHAVCEGDLTAAEKLGHEEFMIDRLYEVGRAKYHQLCNQFKS